jgi:ribokinase
MSSGRNSSRKVPRIVVLGGINTDYVVQTKALPAPGETVQGCDLFVGPGGKGANQAVAAARLGAQVSIIGRVGDEPRGRELIRGLREEGIDTRFVMFDRKHPTGAAIIAVDDAGEKQISAALGANLTLKRADIRKAEALIARADVLLMQFESAVECVVEAAAIARKHEVKVVLDPAPPTKFPRELLKLIYAIRPNSAEAEFLTGVKVKDRASARRAAQVLLKRGVQIAAIQAGEEGDLVVSRDEEFLVRRVKVKAVDATGAGDAFAAGLAVAIAEGMPLAKAAHFANVTAALSTTKFGAQAGMPKRREVEQLAAK